MGIIKDSLAQLLVTLYHRSLIRVVYVTHDP